LSLELKPYPEYRDSGLPWLGEIPAHWGSNPLRRVARVQLSNVDKHSIDGETPVQLCNYTDVYNRDFITSHIEFMEATALPREIEKFRLQEGDVLITKDSESWTDIAVPAYVEADLPEVLCGYHLAQIRPHPGTLKGKYLFRAFQAEPIAYQFRVAANGVTRYGLSSDGIAAGMFPIPPRTEQEAIVRFLDRADGHVSRLIRAKQRLIALLNEQKQAIINRAVTRGLNPDAPTKPTGLDWLPEVPEHWHVVKLARIARVFNGTTPSRMQPRYWEDGTIPWLSSGKVNDYVVEEPSELITTQAQRECSLSLVPRGSIIVGMIGQGRTRGMSALLNIDACINQNLAAVVPKRDVVGRFLHQVMMSLYQHIRNHGRGGNQEALNSEIVSSLKVPLPPHKEQDEILAFVDKERRITDAAIQRAHREIDLIREYRTRLISDVVTGKLDVRGVELPEAVEEGVGPGLDGLESVATEGSPNFEEVQDVALRHQ
jgi:type I restriction enzyme S subunit